MPDSYTNKPVIGITMGDPAGIGPEVIVKALGDPAIRGLARFIVYGMNELVSYAADLAEMNLIWGRDQHDAISRYFPHNIIVADYDEVNWPAYSRHLAHPSEAGGKASFQFVVDAIGDAQSGKIDAVVTGPICKESWHMAGYKYPGHTELFAEKCKAKHIAMMFTGGPFRVTLVTIHEPLFEVRHHLYIGKVFHPIDLTNTALINDFGIARPRIAVAALNPHAGEGGHIGDEEQRIITPAIVMAREAGIDVEGPFPADTLFHQALGGRWDAIIAMYHDQGLIPIKLVAFDQSVNVTLGLPIVRTSVDHGTAFDIMGRNRANPNSMKAAIATAVQMVLARRQRRPGAV